MKKPQILRGGKRRSPVAVPVPPPQTPESVVPQASSTPTPVVARDHQRTIESLDSFGSVDAEDDFRVEEFIPIDVWSSVRHAKKAIVIGRKGTGKSALRLRLLAESSDHFRVADLKFRDYPWRLHHAVTTTTGGSQSRYQETWLFLMLIEACKAILLPGYRGDTADARDVCGSVRGFLSSVWGTEGFDHREIFAPEKYQVTTSLEPAFAGSKLGKVEWQSVPRSELGDNLPRLNDHLMTALRYMLPQDTKIVLAFDELDLDFDSGSDEFKASMAGLIRASVKLMRWSRDQKVPIWPTVLLRDDIYRLLQFGDKNKITDEHVEILDWTDEASGPNSLKGLIEKRIESRIGVSSAEAWAAVFSDQLMRGSQPKYKYITSRTWLRPRDMIKYCNLALDQAKSRHATDIENDDLYNARGGYSKWAYQELDDEVHAHHQDWRAWLEILRRIGVTTFSVTEFKEASESSLLSSHEDPTQILRALYEFSILGFGRPGQKGGGTKEYWSYTSDGVEFDERAAYVKVHLGLKEYLDLKEKS